MALFQSLVLALMAGFSIPTGAAIASSPWLREYCQKKELDSFISYFGGGALMAAISLVLIPHGIENTTVFSAALSFLLGGFVFWIFGKWIKSRGGAMSQFTGMLLDYFPESLILGASAAAGSNIAYLLAILIALQNMPEGFASFTEMRENNTPANKIWPYFILAPLVGPLAAWIGYAALALDGEWLGLLMLFCSGGILYLIFEDIAPGAHVKNKDFPAVGAVSGFLLGMIGVMVI